MAKKNESEETTGTALAEESGEGIEPGAAGEGGEGAAKPEATQEQTVEIDGEQVPIAKIKEAMSGGLREEDYSKKMAEVKEMRRQVADFQETLESLRSNPAKFKKFLALLAEEEGAGEPDEDEKKLFADLTEDDPYGKVFKNMYGMLKGVMREIGEFKKKDEQYGYQDQVTQVQQVLRKTLDETGEKLKFEGDEEKKFWRDAVLSYLKDNPQDYEGEEDLIAGVRKIGKAIAEQINRMGEQRLKKYIESKSGPTPPGPGGAGAPAAKKISFDNLQEGIEAALEEVQSGK